MNNKYRWWCSSCGSYTDDGNCGCDHNTRKLFRNTSREEDISQEDYVKQALINKLKSDLSWKGPNGKVLGHIVFERLEAEMLLQILINNSYKSDQENVEGMTLRDQELPQRDISK